VTTTVLDNESESISNISIMGMTIEGTGEVWPVSASVTATNALSPLGEVELTDVFAASNWGTVSFSTKAMGFDGIGAV